MDPADVCVGIGLTLFSIGMTLLLYVQFLVNQWLESTKKKLNALGHRSRKTEHLFSLKTLGVGWAGTSVFSENTVLTSFL